MWIDQQNTNTNTTNSLWQLKIFDRYFEATGANRTHDLKPRLSNKTRIQYDANKRLYPDVNFIIQSLKNPNENHLFSLEVARGKNAGRVIEQLQRHMQVSKTGFLPEKYGLNQRYSTLFLFEEPSLYESVTQWFREVPSVWHPYFLFGMKEEVLVDPAGGWRSAVGHSMHLIMNQ